MTKKVHRHKMFPYEVTELNNYTINIVKLKCSDEQCDHEEYDWGYITDAIGEVVK